MRPLIIAHRGASAIEPENSLAAFRAAVGQRADGIELDVHGTADGALLVRHDATLAGRPIATLTLEAAREHRLPNGEPVPTLPEALRAIGPDCLVFVEVKSLAAQHDGALLAALGAGPAPRNYHVHSFDHRIIRRLTLARPDLIAGVLSSSYPVEPQRQLEDVGATELWQEASLVDAALANRLHEEGCRIYVWTVDDVGHARALDALGVDGLCTNVPDRLRTAFS